MPLEPGKTLLHYRIVDKLGEGGMGVVWKGVDTTLDREVAIKVLPRAFTEDPERLARFEREAKVLASLNHPHIASIHSLHEAPADEEGRHRFLALEFIDGEDLAERLTRGPLPVDEALEYAGHIAQALEAAHERGVIHRDLKPANVKVTSDGVVKVLDFGLAKALDPHAASGSSPTMLPTVTSAGTIAGTLMGTAAYMSPEQARAKALDRRSDVWSFGCVVYELLTGRAAFAGETITDVLAAIVHTEPDWESLPPSTPPGVRRLLERCLRKDRRERLRDMGDVGLLLREALSAEAPDDAAPAPSPVKRSLLWPALAGILALLLIVAVATREGTGTGDGGGVAKVVAMTQLTDLPGRQIEPALSPDGKQLLYVARDGGDLDIFLQRVGGEKPINLTADHNGADYQPAFSPDGERIAFASERQGGGIYVMGATGETPRRVSDKGHDPAWSPDGRKLVYTMEYATDPYSRTSYVPMWIVDLETGEQRKVTDIDTGAPEWSPDGSRIAFWSHDVVVQGQRDIVTIPAAGGEPVTVTADVATDWDPVWSSDGRWLHFISDRGGSPDLWRVAIDQKTGITRGDPQPVTSGMARVMQVDIAGDGRLALVAERQPGEIVRYDFDPATERVSREGVVLAASSTPFRMVSVAHDGRALTWGTTAPEEHLYMMNVDGSNRRRLLSDEHRNRGPTLSPDGRWVTFYSNRGGSYDVWAIRSDGTDLRALTDEPDLDLNFPVWLPDGGLVIGMQDKDGFHISFLPLGDGGIDAIAAPLPVKPVEIDDRIWATDCSPDGRRLVVQIHEGGRLLPGYYDVGSGKVVRVEDPGYATSMASGFSAWLDDRRFAYWDHDRDAAMIVDVETGVVRVLEGVPGPGQIDFADGGRAMILNRARAESDVWLLTLAE